MKDGIYPPSNEPETEPETPCHDHGSPLQAFHKHLMRFACEGELLAAAVGFNTIWQSCQTAGAMLVAAAGNLESLPDDEELKRVAWLDERRTAAASLIWWATVNDDVDALLVFKNIQTMPSATPEIVFSVLTSVLEARDADQTLLSKQVVNTLKSKVGELRDAAVAAAATTLQGRASSVIDALKAALSGEERMRKVGPKDLN